MPVKGPLTMQQSFWPSSAQMIGWAPGASESPEKEEGGLLGGRGPAGWKGAHRMGGSCKGRKEEVLGEEKVLSLS